METTELEKVIGELNKFYDEWYIFGIPLLVLVAVVSFFSFVVILRQKKSAKSLEADYVLPDDTEEAGKDEHKLEAQKPKPEETESWFQRLRSGLTNTREQLATNLTSLLGGGRKLDEKTLEELHEILFRADLGVTTADKLVNHLKKTIDKDSAADIDRVKAILKEEVTSILDQATPTEKTIKSPPKVILIVGVNGVGKTTTIGKVSSYYLSQGKSVMLCAADTYRAAAIDQLQVWGERLSIKVVKHAQGADPAAVAFDGIKSAVAKKADVLLIDTAGRLHNKKDLMNELEKIKRVLSKDVPEAPHDTWLVLDATTGQNANQQVKAFREVVELTGLVVTKLDGTAKGGAIIGITDSYQYPIQFIGVGEKISDLKPFNAKEFADSIF